MAIPAIFTPAGAIIVVGAMRSEAVRVADDVLQLVDYLDPPKVKRQDRAD